MYEKREKESGKWEYKIPKSPQMNKEIKKVEINKKQSKKAISNKNISRKKSLIIIIYLLLTKFQRK